MPAAAHPSPVLVSLPNGLDLGGVTTWAVNLANGLVARARAVTLIVHPIPPRHTPAQVTLDPRVQVINITRSLPSLHDAAGDLSPFIPIYRDAVERLAATARAPVLFFPNILGDSYALGAAICATHPEQVRVVAWQHADSDYDTAVIARHEAVISCMIAINQGMITQIAERSRILADRSRFVPHGIKVPQSAPRIRPPHANRPLELLYTGRIEHPQKRIGALVFLAQELTRRAIPHRITAIGDGPAAPDFDLQIRLFPSIRRLPALPASDLEAHYRAADAFVLVSRYEGLCISRIEAAAHGCIPVVTTHNSGAGSGLEPGVSAEFIDAKADDDEPTTARRAADAIERLLTRDLAAMSKAAWSAAKSSFSMEKHLNELESALDFAAASPPLFWPSWKPIAFSSSPHAAGSGSLGPNAAENLRKTLEKIAENPDSRALIHGAGQHTRELSGVLANSPVPILGITDDDPARTGQRLWGWEILSPADAAQTGATDIVISSFIHVESIWKRREIYERHGLRMHRIYPQS